MPTAFVSWQHRFHLAWDDEVIGVVKWRTNTMVESSLQILISRKGTRSPDYANVTANAVARLHG